MPDTTNLLDADARVLCDWMIDHSITALRDEIVRQAREGMVHKDGNEVVAMQLRIAELEAENARLRAELETAKRGEQKAWVAGVRWMCEKFSESPQSVRAAFDYATGDVVFYRGESIESIAARNYPAPAVADTPKCMRCGGAKRVLVTVPSAADWHYEPCPLCAVADTGERSPKPMSEDGANLWVEVQDGVCVITHAIARRIVAMGGGK